MTDVDPNEIQVDELKGETPIAIEDIKLIEENTDDDPEDNNNGDEVEIYIKCQDCGTNILLGDIELLDHSCPASQLADNLEFKLHLTCTLCSSLIDEHSLHSHPCSSPIPSLSSFPSPIPSLSLSSPPSSSLSPSPLSSSILTSA